MATAKKPPAKKAPAKKATGKKLARITVNAEKKPEPEKRSVGRPTSYKPEYADLAYKFCLLGANNKKLAELFEVADSTVGKWIAEIEEFSDALKRGREIADANVANSLYHRAIGYEHPEDDIRTVSVGGGRSDIVITPTVKRYAPDTAAATLWLKNRQPTIWRDKVDLEHSGKVGLERLPDEELEARLIETMNRLGTLKK